MFGFENLSDVDADGAAASSSSGSVDAAADGGARCVRDLTPPYGVGRGNPKVYHLALSSLRFVPREDEFLGLDLDCTNTVSRATSSCVAQSEVSDLLFDGLIVDTADGVDNVSTPLFFGAAGQAPGVFNFGLMSQRVREGLVGMTFTLGDVGDLVNDSSIVVLAYPVRSVLPHGQGSCLPRDAGTEPDDPLDAGDRADAAPEPLDAAADAGLRTLARDDVWCRDARFVQGPDGVLGSGLEADNAWIRDGRLVAHFSKLSIPIRDEKTPAYLIYVHLNDVYMSATIEVDAEGLPTLVDGVLTGRVQLPSLLREIALATSRSSAGEECSADQAVMTNVITRLCVARDLSEAGFAPGQPCTAISMALGFETYAVDSPGTIALTRTYEDKCLERVPDRDAGLPAFDFACESEADAN